MHLASLAQVLASLKLQVRDVSFSFNRLDFSDTGSDDERDSRDFIDAIKELILGGKILNHMNFSGMNMPADILRELCETVTKSPLLMSVHLSDLGINHNP